MSYALSDEDSRGLLRSLGGVVAPVLPEYVCMIPVESTRGLAILGWLHFGCSVYVSAFPSWKGGFGAYATDKLRLMTGPEPLLERRERRGFEALALVSELAV